MKFFENEDRRQFEDVQKWEYYFARFGVILLRANGVKNVKEKDLLIKFRVLKNEKEKKSESITKEQRIKEANNFWSAFFAIHGKVNPDALKKKRKK